MNFFANYAVCVQASLGRVHYICGKLLDRLDKAPEAVATEAPQKKKTIGTKRDRPVEDNIAEMFSSLKKKKTSAASSAPTAPSVATPSAS
eukprot:CAMPEP_0170503744 /NCGR_PEP_ID=MMETSP0208-20121228/45772_1 /TAXON_ID=197538 /ORGANISM="Strombidium inclinatum, Strain S3" /LENGTH=89 /DNA_ID=CAMNT_0010783557 /DNA_START=180 /DNA_END=446 /DNA_ORIENTATION=+